MTDLRNANKPANTIRAYRGDLTAFAQHYDGDLAVMGVEPVRAFLSEIAGQAPATRKRKRASVAAFCRWAVRHERLEANPMDWVDTITVPKRLPRPAAAADVCRVLDVVCARRPRKDVPIDVLRDRVLFETAYVCGARQRGLRAVCRGLRPRPGQRARARAWQGRLGAHRALDDRGYVALVRLYLTAPATPPGRCSAPASTAPEVHCPTPPPTTGGRNTASQQESTSTSTSYATHTPPS
ncbi:tyrosine-type recombinase/integrase [Nocardia amamiensis]|uniref:tyrosine-type recombinase/integrase n=1 Tax=Nocardia amamiensis TaxID=404578 RepID=UPI00340FA638